MAAKKEATVVSPSGRTSVTVNVEDDGSFSVKATRDGRTIHDFSDNYEQGGPDSEPRIKSS